MARDETAWTWWTLPPAIAGRLAQRYRKCIPVSSRSCWTTRNMRNPGLGQGRKRLVVASGCREREIRPCSSPVTAPRDAAVPMRLRIFLQRALPAQWVCPGSPRVTAFVMHCVLPSGDQTRAQSGFGVLCRRVSELRGRPISPVLRYQGCCGHTPDIIVMLSSRSSVAA